MMFSFTGKTAAAAIAAACLASSGLQAANSIPPPDEPVRVAVFTDRGARNVGAFRWLELTTLAKGVESFPVDAEGIRAGALEKANVLVMPGGKSVQEAAVLGNKGRSAVKAFIKNGGGYIGTCAGCCLLMEPSKGHPKMLGIIPYKFGPSGGSADMAVAFTRRAEELAGIKRGVQKMRYAEGPVLLHSLPVPDADVEPVAYYNSDINTGREPRQSMAGQVAAVCGTYGKGRLFVTAFHPESDVEDTPVIEGMFKFITGRKVKLERSRRKRGQAAVGFRCDDSFGVETAKLIQRLLLENSFEIQPVSASLVKKGVLRHLDAVLVPDGAGSQKDETGLFGDNLERTREFAQRGGAVIAWGRSAETVRKNLPGAKIAANSGEALSMLREFLDSPVNPPPPAASSPASKPLRVASYIGPGGANFTITAMLAGSKEFTLDFLTPGDIAGGALKNYDLLLQPGGGSSTQYKALGEKGCKEIISFVRNGGSYYGVCAGAFLASQNNGNGNPRMGLVPFAADVPGHYRGGAHFPVELTEEGREVFPGSPATRSILYYGGPAFEPGEPVPDSDMKVLGRYAGSIINVCQPSPVEPMCGKAALVGGRVGKGKVFLSCPHPEKEDANMDMVRGAIKFLTGTMPPPAGFPRMRGARSVIFRTAHNKESAYFFTRTLLPDPDFDVISAGSIDENDLLCADAVVLAKIDKKDWTRAMKDFVAAGGLVVAVAQNEEDFKSASKFKGATIVRTFDEVSAVLKRP